MIDIKGIQTKFDINNLIKVSDLIVFDGPLLSHFITQKGENYLFYWVDVDDNFNRWLFYRVDLQSLQEYICKKSSLYELIVNQPDGFVYSVDIDKDANYQNIRLVFTEDIEKSYLPLMDSYFQFETSDSIDLPAISQKFKTGILEFRITGDSIKYGSISLSKLAPIIPQIEDVRKTLANKFVKERKRHFSEESKKVSTKILLLDTQYDFIYALAGSFRIILKPLGEQRLLDGEKSFSDEFAEEIINLFSSGYSINEINNFSGKYNKNVIKKYSDFITFLEENKLGIDIKWHNSGSNNHYQKNISSNDTLSILKNLSNFSLDDSEELKYKGKFYAINTHTGKYSFESIEGDDFRSTGFFDDQRKQMAFIVSFNKTYEVVIQRKITEQVGRNEIIKDILTSFVEVDN